MKRDVRKSISSGIRPVTGYRSPVTGIRRPAIERGGKAKERPELKSPGLSKP
jgi:hypothetical protein